MALITKRGRTRVHAAEQHAEASLCGVPVAKLQVGSRKYFWFGQVGCKRCRKTLWRLGKQTLGDPK